MTKQIKCFVQGAQGVGKTTLIKHMLKKASPQIEIGASLEIARNLIKLGINNDLNTRIEDYYAYYSVWLREFRKHNEAIVLMDRSILDDIAYARICIHADSWVEKLGFEILELIRKDISYVFYIPIEFDAVEDGVRDTSESYRMRFDKTIKEVMEDARLPYITLRGSVQERSLMAFREISKSDDLRCDRAELNKLITEMATR
jgi:nicotinamide riboside kinase